MGDSKNSEYWASMRCRALNGQLIMSFFSGSKDEQKTHEKTWCILRWLFDDRMQRTGVNRFVAARTDLGPKQRIFWQAAGFAKSQHLQLNRQFKPPVVHAAQRSFEMAIVSQDFRH